jgi:hypothetical protein
MKKKLGDNIDDMLKDSYKESKHIFDNLCDLVGNDRVVYFRRLSKKDKDLYYKHKELLSIKLSKNKDTNE